MLSFSQSQSTRGEMLGAVNSITSGVPFLLIAPDSRAGAMGDAGVATSPDAFSQHWNPAKFAFVEKDLGLSLSYSPWLRNLVGDINLSYLAGYKRIDNRQVIGASLLYFSLGDIVFTDIGGVKLNNFRPNEFAIDASYALLLSKKISGGVALRYIYSNLTGGAMVGNTESHPGYSVAADISMFYQNNMRISDKDAILSFGMNISNIGSKISYTDDASANFIPTNLRLGSALLLEMDKYNSITATIDLNKYLIPTPAIYDSTGNKVLYGYDSKSISVPEAMFRSFYDAPGAPQSDGTRNVLEEELNEITYSIGLEYWYAKQFALRTGFFYEDETKGNRKFFTVGLGLKLNVFTMDFSYLIPTQQHNPLENTLRFSLGLNFEALKKKSVEEEKVK